MLQQPAPSRDLVLGGIVRRSVRAFGNGVVAEGDQRARVRAEQHAVRLRAASVQVHAEVCAVQLARERPQRARVDDAVDRVAGELAQRFERLRRGEHDLGARVRAPQRAVCGDAGEKVAELERAQDDHAHRHVPSASSSDGAATSAR